MSARMRSQKSRRPIRPILPAAAVILCAAALTFVWLRSAGPAAPEHPGSSGAVSPQEKTYTAEDFGIKTVRSPCDFNRNGTDDYTDFLFGARKDAGRKPVYDNSYYQGGYPPDGRGACTDVIWRAFRNAGYSLKDMVDRDIAHGKSTYPGVKEEPDPNIDFRRAVNLKTYLERRAVSLTTDPSQIAAWQPGDIVTFGTNHIGVVSDRRNRSGVPYLIHNAGQPNREEDALAHWGKISGHFRFDASRLDPGEAVPFGKAPARATAAAARRK